MKCNKQQWQEVLDSIQELMPFDTVIGEPYVNVRVGAVAMPFHIRFYESVKKAMVETDGPGLMPAKFTYDADDEWDATLKAAMLKGFLEAKVTPRIDMTAMLAERLDENARRAYGQVG